MTTTNTTPARPRRARRTLLTLAGLLLLGAAAAPHTAHATSLGVEPLMVEITPTRSAAIRVRNTSEDDMPVEVFVYRRDVDENGVQTRIPADDDFIIFPPQASVAAGGRQVFRIRPVAAKQDTSSSYYVSFNQVPQAVAGLGGSGAQLQVVFSFDAAVHIVPTNAKGEAEIAGSRVTTMSVERPTGELTAQPDGSQVPVTQTVSVPAVEIDLHNAGRKYLYLHEQDFRAEYTDAAGKSKTHRWSSADIAKLVKVTLVEPTERRVLRLPLPEDAAPAAVEMSVRPGKTGF